MINKQNWIYNTNVYEVNLRQYSEEGTFVAFSKHLPRLKDMGVQTLWFMPLTPIAQKYKKGTMGSYYACSDYTSVNPEFGDLNDFKILVQQAHALGFKVIIDWVANHTGWDHVWTVQHPEWYKKDEATGDFKKASGMDDIIELDFNNPKLRKAMIAAMKFWVTECAIDGFRCDLAFWVQLDFWIEAKKELNATKELFWLAEADALDHPAYMQVFDAAYTWTWMHKTEAFCKNNLSFAELLDVLNRYQNAPGLKAWFTSNHDENSWNGTEYEKYGEAAKLLAVFSCTWPGMPLIYSGQELPNTKRLAFFDKDVIEWKAEFQLHDFYKTLLNLAAAHPALETTIPVQRIDTPADESLLAFIRRAGDKEVVVLLNFSADILNFDWLENLTGSFRNVFTNEEINFSNQKTSKISGWGYYVFEK